MHHIGKRPPQFPISTDGLLDYPFCNVPSGDELMIVRRWKTRENFWLRVAHPITQEVTDFKVLDPFIGTNGEIQLLITPSMHSVSPCHKRHATLVKIDGTRLVTVSGGTPLLPVSSSFDLEEYTGPFEPQANSDWLHLGLANRFSARDAFGDQPLKLVSRVDYPAQRRLCSILGLEAFDMPCLEIRATFRKDAADYMGLTLTGNLSAELSLVVIMGWNPLHRGVRFLSTSEFNAVAPEYMDACEISDS